MPKKKPQNNNNRTATIIRRNKSKANTQEMHQQYSMHKDGQEYAN